mgnify:CR=1 FL=1
MPYLYRMLDAEARRWWWHAELRRQGKAEEARRMERQSIRTRLGWLRQAWLVVVGRPGNVTLHLEPSERGWGHVEGLEPQQTLDLVARYRPDVPIVDVRHCPDEAALIRLVIRGPMLAMLKADPPQPDGTWHSFNYVPPEVYLALYEAIGARVHWGRYADQQEEARRRARPTLEALGLATAARMSA